MLRALPSLPLNGSWNYISFSDPKSIVWAIIDGIWQAFWITLLPTCLRNKLWAPGELFPVAFFFLYFMNPSQGFFIFISSFMVSA